MRSRTLARLLLLLLAGCATPWGAERSRSASALGQGDTLELQLHAERDRVHVQAGRVGDPQPEAQRRRRRMRDRLRPQDLERGRGDVHAPTPARYPVTASVTLAPPEMPSQLDLTTPTSP